MRITLLFCAALLAAPVSSGQAQAVWKWKDDKGVTHYSDQPGPNAVRVDLSTQTYSSDEARTDIAVNTSPTSRAATTDDSYTALRITQPTPDQTVFASEGPVRMEASLEPALQSGHSIQFLLDGQNVSGENSTSLSATLPQVERGTHSLRIKVVDRGGETVVASTTVTFHVHQTSVNQLPPKVQLPPRPQPKK